MPDKMPIRNMLIDRGCLAQGQLNHAVCLKKGGPGSSIEEILTEFGYVTGKALLSCVATRDYMEVVPFGLLRADRKATVVIEPPLAVRGRILPMRFEEECLVVAVVYPVSPGVLAEVEALSGMGVRIVLAQEKELKQTPRKAYDNASGHIYRENAHFPMTESGAVPGDSVSELSSMKRVESTPVVRMVNAVIEETFHKDTSSVRVEPGKDDLVIRIRINGDLMIHTTLKVESHRFMITRLKLVTGMDIAEKRPPQDGKYRYGRGEASTDLRISTPSFIYGEKAVLRLLENDRDNSLMGIEHLDMEEEQRTTLEHILRTPHGMALVAGPTGSRKAIAPYAVLNRMAKKKINIVTMEDPAGRVMEEIIQVRANPKVNLAFASTLHSILKQDPDVIMVGEVRDEGAVDIGVRAAITGHLVLSTLRINDCASTILRPRNTGVPPRITATSPSGTVAQRLVRLLCSSCHQSYVPGERERRIFAERKKHIPDRLWKVAGRPFYDDTGYTRRTAVCEIMDVDEQIKAMIPDKEPLSSIREYQEQKGSMPLRDHVLRMAAGRQTDIGEVGKMLYFVQQEAPVVQKERGATIMSIHMKGGEKRTEGSTLAELTCVIAILEISVAMAVPSYQRIQDRSTEQVAIINAGSNYTLGKAQQDILNTGVLKNSEKEEYHFDKDSNSAYWEDQTNEGAYKAYYYGDTSEGKTGPGN